MLNVVSAELSAGQRVVVMARWLLVLFALLVVVWNPDPLPQLRVQITAILVVAIGNFVMHVGFTMVWSHTPHPREAASPGGG